jgi:tRNA pseudouridine38-40 synthase
MKHPYFLRLAYLGAGFHGWQIQSSLQSVQAELWTALRSFDPTAPMPQGTGRTDSGVHAKAQGVLAHLSRPWEPYRLQAALNAYLPQDVRVMSVLEAPEGFFPRQHAVAKRYVYRIQEGPAEDPFSHGRRWHIHGATALDRGAMLAASRVLIGEHDFSSFRHKECVARSPLRQIHSIRLEESWPLLDLVFEGNRFLMHQVRIMTGTLVDIGKGRIQPDAMGSILAARDRKQAGHTAPPEGLYLDEVWYQAKWRIGAPCPWGEPD